MSSPNEPRFSRRTLLAWAGASGASLWPHATFAVEPEVPLRLQVDLLNRVLPYDRNLATRVHNGLVVAVLTDPTDPDSTRIGAHVLAEFHGRSTLGGVRPQSARLSFSGTQATVDECRRRNVGVLYVTPGVRVPIASLARALEGLDVLTVAAIPEQVRQGLVLGFAVRSGKPRLLVNLTQARVHHVNFRADFLRMVEVVG